MGLFSDKVAIVTGGGSGIARALGQELARRGARVTLADVNPQRLEEVAESITKAGYHAERAQLDVSHFEAVQKLVNDTVAYHGRLDYVFNNAGIGVGGEACDVSLEDWRKVLDVNLFGVINGVAAA